MPVSTIYSELIDSPPPTPATELVIRAAPMEERVSLTVLRDRAKQKRHHARIAGTMVAYFMFSSNRINLRTYTVFKRKNIRMSKRRGPDQKQSKRKTIYFENLGDQNASRERERNKQIESTETRSASKENTYNYDMHTKSTRKT